MNSGARSRVARGGEGVHVRGADTLAVLLLRDGRRLDQQVVQEQLQTLGCTHTPGRL